MGRTIKTIPDELDAATARDIRLAIEAQAQYRRSVRAGQYRAAEQCRTIAELYSAPHGVRL